MEIRGGRVFCPDGVFRDTDIYIENGRFTESSTDGHIMNAAGYYIIPGLIDIHMHGCVSGRLWRYEFLPGSDEPAGGADGSGFSQCCGV